MNHSPRTKDGGCTCPVLWVSSWMCCDQGGCWLLFTYHTTTPLRRKRIWVWVKALTIVLFCSETKMVWQFCNLLMFNTPDKMFWTYQPPSLLDCNRWIEHLHWQIEQSAATQTWRSANVACPRFSRLGLEEHVSSDQSQQIIFSPSKMIWAILIKFATGSLQLWFSMVVVRKEYMFQIK